VGSKKADGETVDRPENPPTPPAELDVEASAGDATDETGPADGGTEEAATGNEESGRGTECRGEDCFTARV
jgi:hypothetical protein